MAREHRETRKDPDAGRNGAPTARDAHQGPSGALRIRLICILGALSAAPALSIDMYMSALPALSRDLSANASLSQLTLTACLIGVSVGQLVSGPVSDAWGRKGPLLIGTAMFTLASALCVVTPSVGMLLVLRFVQGFAGATGLAIGRAVVSDLYQDEEASRFFSMLMLVAGVSPVVAPLVGGQLLTITTWRGIFVLVAALGAGMLVSTGLGVPETLPAGGRRGGGGRETVRTFGTLLRDRPFVGYVLAIGLSFAALFTCISGGSFVLEDIYGMSAQWYSAVLGVNGLGIVVATQVSARVTRRVPMPVLLTGGLAMGIAGGVLLLVSVATPIAIPGVLPGMFLTMAAVGLVLPNATALALSGRAANVTGAASALLGLAQTGIGGLAAPLAGVAGAHTAVPMGVVVMVTVAAAGASLTLARASRDVPLA